jgi:Tfp pilus assembly protein PilP
MTLNVAHMANKKDRITNLSRILAIVGILFFSACAEEEDQSYRDFNNKTVRPGMPSPEAKKRLKRGQGTGLVEKTGKAGEDDGRLKLPEITEASFIEELKCRDPFAPFLEMFDESTIISTEIQRDIKLEEYNLSDLRLIGIITNIGNPKAMVVIPDGTGFVVKGGDFVGRTEFVKHSSGEMIPVNWKVARIHGSGKEEERGIYFKRDATGLVDRKKIEVTRFLPLHPYQ